MNDIKWRPYGANVFSSGYLCYQNDGHTGLVREPVSIIEKQNRNEAN
jgi:hypothetical protein